MSILIITDSRGRGLQEIFDTNYPSSCVQVLVHPGAGSELAALKSMPYLRVTRPDLIVIATGICDLTWKNKATREVGLRHLVAAENVRHVTQAMRSAFDLISPLGDFKIAFATLTGADLADCNYQNRRHMNEKQYLNYCSRGKTPHPNQTILNESVLAINKQVVRMNCKNRTKTVWLAGLVHSYYKKSHHHCYKRLLDGCHPDHNTRMAWAGQIIKSAHRILN